MIFVCFIDQLNTVNLNIRSSLACVTLSDCRDNGDQTIYQSYVYPYVVGGDVFVYVCVCVHLIYLAG